MRILWLSHFLLHPETGFGALQRSRNLLREVCRHHEVHLLSLVTRAQYADGELLAAAGKSLGEFCETVEFLPRSGGSKAAIVRSFARHEPYSVELYHSVEFQGRVAALWHEKGCELLHADTLGIFEPAGRSVVAVLNHHNIESAMMARRAAKERKGARKWFLERETALLKSYERRWCKCFTHHLCVSPEDSAELGRSAHVPEAQRSTIENPVDTDYFHPPAAGTPREPELLFMGGMDWYPNRDAVLSFLEHLWPRLSAEHPALRFTVVGRHEGLKAEEGRWEGRVRFAGFVPDVRPYLHRARAFICPMRDGGGTRLKIVDALAAGLPVLSTRLGCEGLSVRHGEEVLFAETPQEWSECVRQIFDDEPLWQRLSAEGRKLIERHYSARTVGARLAEVYTQVAAGARR